MPIPPFVKNYGFLVLLGVFCSYKAEAVTFLSFDPRSMAIGGTGVAYSDPGNASLFNPALIVLPQAEQKTTQVRPFLGARVIDRSNFLGGLYHYQDNNAEAKYDRTWTAMERLYSRGALGPEDLRRVSRAARVWDSDVDGLSNRPLHVSGSFGLTVSQSDSAHGSGFYVRQYSIGGALIDMSEQNRLRIDQGITVIDLLADIVEGTREVEALGEAIGFERLETLIDEAAATGAASPELETYYDYPKVEALVDASIQLGMLAVELDEYFELDRLSAALTDGGNQADLPDLQQYLRYQTDEELDATIHMEGVGVTEMGVTLANQIEKIDGLALGVTLKYVHLNTIDFSYGASKFSLSQLRDKQFQKSHNMLNADLGVSYKLNPEYSVGLVVKNIVPQKFDTVLGNTIEFDPIARIGIARVSGDLALAAGLDLTSNDAKGFDPDKRYLSLGAEYAGWNSTALRAGVRIDTHNHTYTPSLGIGLGSQARSMDLALTVAPEYDEIGGSIQATWTF